MQLGLRPLPKDSWCLLLRHPITASHLNRIFKMRCYRALRAVEDIRLEPPHINLGAVGAEPSKACSSLEGAISIKGREETELYLRRNYKTEDQLHYLLTQLANLESEVKLKKLLE